MNDPAGCTLRPVEHQECRTLIAWALGQGGPPSWLQGVQWLLAHCDDGVIWGRLESDGRWRRSSEAFPKESPPLREQTIQQLRIFGLGGEALLWRSDGAFHGRWATEGAAPLDEALQPQDESYLLLGDRLLGPPQDGFCVLGDATGSRHAAPIECNQAELGQPGQGRYPLHLQVRHYFEQDSESGAVRICMTRLVNLAKI